MIKRASVVVVVTILIISGILKISGVHPMIGHFREIGLNPTLIKLLGTAEIIFSLLFLFTPTSRIGLLLLTAYFGGAIAAEIPYNQVAAPLIPLVLIWLVAFVRQRSAFLITVSDTNL